MRRIFAKLDVGTRAEMIAVLSNNPYLLLMPKTNSDRVSADSDAATK